MRNQCAGVFLALFLYKVFSLSNLPLSSRANVENLSLVGQKVRNRGNYNSSFHFVDSDNSAGRKN